MATWNQIIVWFLAICMYVFILLFVGTLVYLIYEAIFRIIKRLTRRR